MVHDTHGLHHMHVRKRIHQRHEEYPSKDRLKNIVDKLVYFGVFYGPLVTLPQVWKIWSEKTTAGVSVFSWAAYLVLGAVWLTYGVLHKEKPIVLSQILWISIEVMIVLGWILYG